MIGEFPTQLASNAKNVSIWWRHLGECWIDGMPGMSIYFYAYQDVMGYVACWTHHFKKIVVFFPAFMENQELSLWQRCLLLVAPWFVPVTIFNATSEDTTTHDDVIKWKSFSALLALCAENSPVPVTSPHKGQWRGALMFSLIYAWINEWVNNREAAGDLRRQRGHYDVIVMLNLFNCTLIMFRFKHFTVLPVLL